MDNVTMNDLYDRKDCTIAKILGININETFYFDFNDFRIVAYIDDYGNIINCDTYECLDGRMVCLIMNNPEIVHVLPRDSGLSDEELMVCNFLRAKYITCNRCDDGFVTFWSSIPDVTSDGEYVQDEYCRARVLARLSHDFYKSIKPGTLLYLGG